MTDRKYKPKSLAALSGSKICRSKTRYRELDQAKIAARHIRQNCDGTTLRPYHCHICRGYHLTSQERLS